MCLAFWRKPEFAVTINYGQRAAAGEIRAAAAVCDVLNITHHILEVDLGHLGSGDMAGSAPLPIAKVPEWWPYRNQMLVTLGAMKVIGLGVSKLLIGALSSDAAHVDGRREFLDALDGLLAMQEGHLRLEAPAVTMSATELVKESRIPDELLAWAHSCHVSDFACGNCRGCRKHYETLRHLGRSTY